MKKDNIPKIASLIYICFISIFALDVFDANYSLKQQLIGLVIHLIPTFGFILLFIISLYKRQYGGILFIVASFLFTLVFQTYQSLTTLVLLSGPPLLIGVMFLHPVFHAVKKERN